MNFLILFIKIYQLTISPVLGTCCRFSPSCSHYFIEALRKHGIRKGTVLGIKRIFRCRPNSNGGQDPVP